MSKYTEDDSGDFYAVGRYAIDLEANKTKSTNENRNGSGEYSGDHSIPFAQPLPDNAVVMEAIPETQIFQDPTFSSNIGNCDIAIRMSFVRKVFGIVTIQLAITFGFVLVCALEENTRNYFAANWWPYAVGLSVYLVLVIIFTCFSKIARTFPINYIFLAGITLALSLGIGGLAAISDPEIVIIAMGTTIGVTIGLVLFAFQTKIDFTGIGPYLMVALLCLIMYSIIAIIFGFSPGLGYSILGTVIFSLYIVYDCQLLIGGKGRLQYSIDDYAMVALSLYMDIVNLFLFILSFFNDT